MILCGKSLIPFTIVLLTHSGISTSAAQQILSARYDKKSETISVFRNDDELLLTQHVNPTIRPYIHPIVAPDGNGILTEFSPAHHKHQTGLYWGLKKVNGRDFFMNWREDYWRKVSATVIAQHGTTVKWQTSYDLLDENGNAILRETQTWTMQQADGKFFLDLEWNGKATKDITMEQFYVGGLFLRMPWHEGIAGDAINSDGKINSTAEGQPAKWIDIGLQIDGRDDKGHVAIFEHPANSGFPNAWRVDNELGVGPSRQIQGDWSIPKEKSEVIRYRLVIYTGTFDNAAITRLWTKFASEK
jgi:hypothetical protein